MAVTQERIDIALKVKPQDVCLVPEKREERTTEGGLDVIANFDVVKTACDRLGKAGIRVSLFIGPDIKQIDAAKEAGAPVIEIHTGAFADAEEGKASKDELMRIITAVAHGVNLGLAVNAGHGLNFHNVKDRSEKRRGGKGCVRTCKSR